MRGLVEGDLWQSSSNSEYKPEFDEEEGSDGQISLEAKSHVDGEMWETMGSEQDVGLEHHTTEGSNGGVQTKRPSGGGVGCGGWSYRR